MTPVAVLDMNETTLDLAPVRAVVDELLAGGGGFAVWFQKLLQLSMVTAEIDEFVPFGTLAQHAYDSVADAAGLTPAAQGFDRVAAAIGSIGPYPEVPDALERLRVAGWTIAALTNSGQRTLEHQVEGAGLNPMFDHLVSVEAVGVYKPKPAPYLHLLERLGVDPAGAVMVACHDWDLAGARRVGMQTAFVRRPGMAYAASYPPPDHSFADFSELASGLLSS